MEVVYPSTLKKWSEKHKSNSNVETALSAWLCYMTSVQFSNPNELRQGKFSPDVVSIQDCAAVPNHLLRVVWNICGNEFRFIAHVGLKGKEVFLKGFYTHTEYDEIDLTSHKYD